MSNVLKDLKPNDVFKYFEEITRIPRGSGNEKGISDYLVAFAKEHNLEVIQDEALNVIIKKPGTSGYENAPTVILQGHMDMVNEKNQGTEHDFDKDPLKLRIEGDMIYATGTTLGADNGIAIAYAMALLASKDIAHPPVEVLVTTDEETGMSGAMALNPEHLNGRMLINIDSEEEGKLLVSCAGGVRTTSALGINWESSKQNETYAVIRIRGLKGGHSGMEIHKGRGNANKLMGRVLHDVLSTIDFQLVSLNGGAKNNAIPREADAVIALDNTKIEAVKAKVEEWNKVFKNEFKVSDADVKVQIEALNSKFEKIFSKDTTKKAVELLFVYPSGIQTMSMEIKDLVQSSTNLGVVTTFENEVHYDSATRSSVKSLKYDAVDQTKVIAEAMGAKFSTQSDYPDWQYNAESKLRKIFEKVYKDINGIDPEIVAIHAGVECGLFKEKFGEIDMISFGPNLYDVHTPEEHMSISSTQRMWDYLVEVLKEMK
ncbi:aminoacyl-histidine dipeptidase [Clostridium sp. YIM B02515]|uniref:Aminoacyl-histidine dipeptidase n=1 Tax=Clostridium rhizosphaerae TaxID=2803861 RepID=A0ABS1TK82_9CLOT|nr:aminoacyl-histidine dipeptidase [Clostridium rhizosphaerae]MBL4938378.1 aminoacyl-histidine dipeptidase [Clostridium rhizosphaerae]